MVSSWDRHPDHREALLSLLLLASENAPDRAVGS